MALTTRPSQRSDGRMLPAAEVTIARQPRRTPSSAANGMASACPPAKPTTSQGICGPTAVSIASLVPTDMAWIGPATSTISPRTPTTRPKISTPSISTICSARAFKIAPSSQKSRSSMEKT
jgi:hypothetical protein